MRWVYLANETDVPFWTSDHPVGRYNDVEPGPRGNLGLRCHGIQLYLPLSPIASLCACDPVMYGALPSRAVVERENVVFLNSLAVVTSSRYLFSSGPDFALAESMIADDQELADPLRRRTRVGGPAVGADRAGDKQMIGQDTVPPFKPPLFR